MIRIKICGITNLADAKAATDAGANALGFNFYEKSLRRVVTADASFSMSTFDRYADAFAFLLDGARAGQYGGSGETTDWDFARRSATNRRIILSGGLKVENVAEAIRIVRPYGVDVASGLETKPGKKDHTRLKEFIDEVRRAEQQLETPKENPTQP